MANLTKVEDLLSSAPLYTFDAKPKATRADASWQRRSGTYTVLGHDYGVNPFGTYAAPMGVRKLAWTFRVVVPATGNPQTALDTAAASVHRAMAKRRLHRLVRTYAGHEQVVVAQVVDFQDVTASADNWRHRDFAVTWELTSPWADRLARGPHRVGDTPGVALNFTSLVMGYGSVSLSTTAQQFTIVADGTDGLAATTVDDTGPLFTIVGPFGGDSGFILYNLTALVQDTSGAIVTPYIQVNRKLALGETLLLDCGALAATLGGVDIWTQIFVPDWQPYWQVVEAGNENIFELVCVGANPTVDALHSKITTAWIGLYE